MIISSLLDVLFTLLAEAGGILFVSGEGRHIARDMGIAGSEETVGVVYIIFGIVSLLVALIKFIGGIMMVRARGGAGVWAMVTGIISCLQIWCGVFCVLPLGIGIFAIVVSRSEGTRRYLAQQAGKA